MRRPRRSKWATVQAILSEAKRVTFQVVRRPMMPDQYIEATYDTIDGTEQRVHRGTAESLRKALQKAPGTWTLALVSSTKPNHERLLYCRLTPLA